MLDLGYHVRSAPRLFSNPRMNVKKQKQKQKEEERSHLRFKPYLKRFAMEQSPTSIADENFIPNGDINVAFFNIPFFKRLRELTAAMIDEPNDVYYYIAKHILQMGQKHEDETAQNFTTPQLMRFISYAKTLKPKINKDVSCES